MSDPQNLLKKLYNKKIKNEEEYKELKHSLFKNLFSLIPLIVNKIPKGHYLFRTTPINRDDLINAKKDSLSYRPLSVNYPYFNRCSEPNESHFYCSTERWTSIGECSYFLSMAKEPIKNFEKKHELLEVGVWEVQRDLYVADMRFGKFSHLDQVSHLNTIKSAYNKFAEDQFIIDFFKYINERFEIPIDKDHHLDYWLTACYSNYLFCEKFKSQPNWGNMEEFNEEVIMSVDGIFYHSVKGLETNPPLKGLNLALSINLINEGQLKLIKAGIFKSSQLDEKTFLLDDLQYYNLEIMEDNWLYVSNKEFPLKSSQ